MENLQLVLTGDKGVTTDLTIFLSASERELFVYLGVALLERVAYNRNQFAYKMLIGRLVNAGVALAKLKRQFNHDSRTMKRWSKPNFNELICLFYCNLVIYNFLILENWVHYLNLNPKS